MRSALFSVDSLTTSWIWQQTTLRNMIDVSRTKAIGLSHNDWGICRFAWRTILLAQRFIFSGSAPPQSTQPRGAKVQ